MLNINFSSRTSSMDTQRNLESNVEKRTKDTFGPPSGKKLVVFIDDLNMPKVDTYGTQQPIALLKLLLEKGGMYDRGKDLNWKKYQDLVFIAAMGKVRRAFSFLSSKFSMFVSFRLARRWSKRCRSSIHFLVQRLQHHVSLGRIALPHLQFHSRRTFTNVQQRSSGRGADLNSNDDGTLPVSRSA